MSGRLEVICEKQGHNDPSSWSTRVLTIDNATRTLTVSRCHHPNNIFYHAVRVKEVYQWPHFVRPAIVEDFKSLHAKRTLCIVGIEVPVPSFSSEFIHHGDPHLHPGHHSADVTSDTSSSSAPQYAFMEGNRRKKSRPLVSGGCESWVIRFTTQESYDVAVAALKQMAEVHFNPKHNPEETLETGVFGGPLFATPIGPL